jgi:hypothetical protein
VTRLWEMTPTTMFHRIGLLAKLLNLVPTGQLLDVDVVMALDGLDELPSWPR